jgi:DNA-binding XRE family transcriptional regulator
MVWRYSEEKRAAIPKQFKQYRSTHLLTQKELGRMLGVSRAAINLIERRHTVPKYETLRKFEELEAKERRREQRNLRMMGAVR